MPDARAAWRTVTEQRAAGYDLLKIHPGVPRAAFDEVARTAQAEGIPFAGHIPADVGLLHALDSGIRTVEHLDGFVEVLQKDGTTIPARDRLLRLRDRGHGGRGEDRAAWSRAIKAAGAWNTPTQVLLDNIYGGATLDEVAARPEMKYVPPAMLAQWKTGAGQFRGPGFDPAAGEALRGAAPHADPRPARRAAPAWCWAPTRRRSSTCPASRRCASWSRWWPRASRRTRRSRRAPATPRSPWACRESFGTVEAGRRADLLLLDADPLADIRNVWKRAGVVLAGRWLPASELDARLAEFAKAP